MALLFEQGVSIEDAITIVGQGGGYGTRGDELLLQADEQLWVPTGGLTDRAVLMNAVERSIANATTVREITGAFDEECLAVASAAWFFKSLGL